MSKRMSDLAMALGVACVLATGAASTAFAQVTHHAHAMRHAQAHHVPASHAQERCWVPAYTTGYDDGG